MACQYPLQTTLGSLGNDDDDGSENVAKKINLHPFKLYRVLFFLELNSQGLFAVSKRERKILGKPCF